MWCLCTHPRVDLVPEVIEVPGATQATHLPDGVVGGDAMVTSAVNVQTHQVHAEAELWRLVGGRREGLKERKERGKEKNTKKKRKRKKTIAETKKYKKRKGKTEKRREENTREQKRREYKKGREENTREQKKEEYNKKRKIKAERSQLTWKRWLDRSSVTKLSKLWEENWTRLRTKSSKRPSFWMRCGELKLFLSCTVLT